MKKCFGILIFLFIFVLGIFPSYAAGEYETLKLKEGVYPYGDRAYNNGLIPVLYDGSISQNGNWAYLTEDGNVFSNKYTSGFDFSEGLTSIVKEVDGISKLGYMDRKGKVVIEPKFDMYVEDGVSYAGRFKGREALVYIDKEGGYWQRIDKNGSYISDEKLSTKAILSKDSKDKLIYNNSETTIYQDMKDIKVFGETIKNVRLNNGKGVVSIENGKNKGSYIVIEKEKVENLKVSKSNQKIVLDGKETSLEGYLINGNNYFKLRDVAYILRDKEKNFDIKWNKDTREIDLYLDKGYKTVGGELKPMEAKKVKARETESKIYLDGERIRLKGYLIDGNNYFKLRDIGSFLDMGIGWDKVGNSVNINTDERYTE